MLVPTRSCLAAVVYACSANLLALYPLPPGSEDTRQQHVVGQCYSSRCQDYLFAIVRRLCGLTWICLMPCCAANVDDVPLITSQHSLPNNHVDRCSLIKKGTDLCSAD
jgi:hypothetical protein